MNMIDHCQIAKEPQLAADDQTSGYMWSFAASLEIAYLDRLCIHSVNCFGN
jgi:hypothetical protein